MSAEHGPTADAGWGDAADAWARAAAEPETGASAVATAWMLQAARLEPGHRVLELACGAGRVGLQAASLVSPGGSVVLTDFAEPMVRAAAAGKARLGLDNVETRVLDAERGSFDNEPFDVVLCRFGFMLMNDPLKALRASAAALVPEGKLVLAVWGSAEENPWLSTILTSFMDHFDAPPPEPDTPGPFRLGEPDRLRYLLERGGFREVAIERLEGEQTYDSPEGWWNDVLAVSGPLAAAFGSLPDDDARSIRDRALARAPLRVAEDGSVRFPAVMLGAEATRR